VTTTAIRVDGSPRLGFGHLMRCLALADALRAAGSEVVFLCGSEAGHRNEFPVSKGYRVATLPPGRSAEWSSREDAARTIALLDGLAPVDWMVVDHYGLSRDWEHAVRSHCGRLMVIDDLADRPHECDVLLDQNLSALRPGRYDGLVSGSCERLLGPEFALLRAEFRVARESARSRDGQVRRMLVSFGAGDQADQTLLAIRAIDRIAERRFAVEVVIGPDEQSARRVREACAGRPGIRVHCDVADMAAMIASADVAIGGGGVSMLERCCLGLPSLVVTLADNQESGARALAERGAIISLGRAERLDEASLEIAVAAVLRAPELLHHVSTQAWQLVDGRGAIRVARRLCGTPIGVRLATSDDRDRALEWRNAEATRAGSFEHGRISADQHRTWFSAALSSDSRVLLIGETGAGPVGVLRYDIEGSLASVSVYLAPDLHGRGLGPELLRAGDRWLRENLPKVSQVRAQILSSNAVSRAAFRSAGFGEYGEILVKQLRT
jgi:UDP-2,4-diacetamido-2,4,6-trideoxy-beta-L-altropyranose hydrolase